jgi:intergrase/recombinase
MSKKQMSEKDMEKVTENTAEILKKQEKVKVRLYLPPEQKQKLEAAMAEGKNVQWPYQVVAINGYIYQIQLGKTVEVPKSVAEVLEHAGLI